MRKTTLSLSMLLACAMTFQSATASNDRLQSLKTKYRQAYTSTAMKANAAKTVGNAFVNLGKAHDTEQSVKKAVKRAVNPTETTFGFLTGPDGSQWYYEQVINYYIGGGDDNGGYQFRSYMKSSTVTVYDSDNNVIGSFDIELDSSHNCNKIDPYGYVTNTFFDSDASSYEITVGLHYADKTDDTEITQAYSLTTGKKVWEKAASSQLVYTMGSGSATSRYQRMCLMRYGIVGTGSAKKVMAYYDVYAPANDSHSQPYVEYTFSSESTHLDYLLGMPFYATEVNGKMNYIVSYYDKVYADGVPDTDEDMVATKDNSLIMEVYEANGDNTSCTYTKLHTIKAPIEVPSEALYRTAGVGVLFEKPVSNDYYVSGGRAYVVNFSDYITSDDANYDSYVVFDENSNAVKTLVQDLMEDQMSLMPSINGQSDQLAYLRLNGSSQQICLIDLPSGDNLKVMPTQIGEDYISTQFGRVPSGDSYKYIIKLATGGMDADGNLLGRLAWTTSDFQLDHISTFNLGMNGENFSPLLTSITLNPYLFDSDDEYEFIYMAQKERNDGSSVLDNVLEVAKDDGTVIRSFVGDDSYSISNNTSVLAMSGSKNQLMVAYSNNDNTSSYKVEFYELPFVKFSNGGDGTTANPYLVSTAGDLQAMGAAPDASYKLVNDIDMYEMSDRWSPIANFGGSLDGDSHTITGFYSVGGSTAQGVFASLNSGATVKNLTFVEPVVSSSSISTTAMGVLAGEATSAVIDGVHVYDATVSSTSGTPVVGGIVANAAKSTISSCSFDGDINAAQTANVGGIVGEATDGTSINASKVSASLSASEALGGIAGELSDSYIDNSRADVALNGATNVGGIAGIVTGETGRGTVKHSYAEGSIVGASNIGGVVGSMKSSTATTKDVDACLSNVKITATDNTANYIVGSAAADESGISNCYTLSTASINDVASTGTDAATVSGKTIARSDVNKPLLAGIGYAYGSDANSPWTGVNGLPTLYFEDKANSVAFSGKSLVIDVAATKEITVTVFGGSVENLEITSSNADIATATITNIDEEANTATVTVTVLAAGSATITASIDGQTATCVVSDSSTGISKVVADGAALAISIDGGVVKANGATLLTVYGISGQTVASVKGDSLSTKALVAGVYVAVAKNAKGNTATTKFVVR